MFIINIKNISTFEVNNNPKKCFRKNKAAEDLSLALS